MTDLEILQYKVGDTTINDMTAITFLQWIAKKIDGVSATTAAATEVRLAVSSGMVMGKMPSEEKVRLIRKLLIAVPDAL